MGYLCDDSGPHTNICMLRCEWAPSGRIVQWKNQNRARGKGTSVQASHLIRYACKGAKIAYNKDSKAYLDIVVLLRLALKLCLQSKPTERVNLKRMGYLLGNSDTHTIVCMYR